MLLGFVMGGIIGGWLGFFACALLEASARKAPYPPDLARLFDDDYEDAPYKIERPDMTDGDCEYHMAPGWDVTRIPVSNVRPLATAVLADMERERIVRITKQVQADKDAQNAAIRERALSAMTPAGLPFRRYNK